MDKGTLFGVLAGILLVGGSVAMGSGIQIFLSRSVMRSAGHREWRASDSQATTLHRRNVPGTPPSHFLGPPRSKHVSKVEVQPRVPSSVLIASKADIHAHDKGLKTESQPHHAVHRPMTETDVSR